MIICNKYEVPDKCPSDCKFNGSFSLHGQNAICGRCPVFCCAETDYGDGVCFPLVDPSDYREDWAVEWVKFFNDNDYTPHLFLD